LWAAFCLSLAVETFLIHMVLPATPTPAAAAAAATAPAQHPATQPNGTIADEVTTALLDQHHVAIQEVTKEFQKYKTAITETLTAVEREKKQLEQQLVEAEYELTKARTAVAETTRGSTAYRVQIEQDLARVKEIQSAEIAKLQQQNEQEIAQLKSKQSAEVAKLQRELEIRGVQQQAAIDVLTKHFKNEMEDLKKQHEAATHAVKTDITTAKIEESLARQQIASLTEANQVLSQQNAKLMKSLAEESRVKMDLMQEVNRLSKLQQQMNP